MLPLQRWKCRREQLNTSTNNQDVPHTITPSTPAITEFDLLGVSGGQTTECLRLPPPDSFLPPPRLPLPPPRAAADGPLAPVLRAGGTSWEPLAAPTKAGPFALLLLPLPSLRDATVTCAGSGCMSGAPCTAVLLLLLPWLRLAAGWLLVPTAALLLLLLRPSAAAG